MSSGTAGPDSENGWHFLTGTQDSIDKVTKAAGFNYAWDDKTQQFAHAGGIMITTPAGKLVTVLLRHRLCAKGCEVRSDGFGRVQDRKPG